MTNLSEQKMSQIDLILESLYNDLSEVDPNSLKEVLKSITRKVEEKKREVDKTLNAIELGKLDIETVLVKLKEEFPLLTWKYNMFPCFGTIEFIGEVELIRLEITYRHCMNRVLWEPEIDFINEQVGTYGLYDLPSSETLAGAIKTIKSQLIPLKETLSKLDL